MARKKALGKGLGTLLQSARVAEEIDQLQNPPSTELEVVRDRMLRELPVEVIERGRYQPRRDMSPEALEELASSIRQQGVMQPIVVRPVGEPLRNVTKLLLVNDAGVLLSWLAWTRFRR